MLEPDHHARSRKDLAGALRQLREAAGLSGERLAARCAMSQTKISRIETGRLVPSVIDVERILKALDVPREVANDLLALARIANVDYASWRAYARIGLWQKQAEIKALEESSRLVRQFLPAIPSGLLQITDYARETLTPRVTGRAAIDVGRAVLARLDRQTVMDDLSRQFVFLMPEHAVRWQRASPTVMAHQLRHMAEIATTKPNVEIAVIPQTSAVLASPLNGFVLYDDRLVVIELFSGEIVLRDPQDISYHSNLFDYFMASAVTGPAAAVLLETIVTEFMRLRD